MSRQSAYRQSLAPAPEAYVVSRPAPESVIVSRDGKPIALVESQHKKVVNLLVWFIVIAVIAFFILWVTKWPFVQKTVNGQPTGEADAGKALLWALIVALVVVLLIWLFTSCGK